MLKVHVTAHVSKLEWEVCWLGDEKRNFPQFHAILGAMPFLRGTPCSGLYRLTLLKRYIPTASLLCRYMEGVHFLLKVY